MQLDKIKMSSTALYGAGQCCSSTIYSNVGVIGDDNATRLLSSGNIKHRVASRSFIRVPCDVRERKKSTSPFRPWRLKLLFW
jgi:hypothetical protein